MSAAHTPGPWKSRTGFDSDMREIYAPNPKIKKPFMPTQLADVRADCKEGKANARLIAAAPDLLEALKFLVRCSAPMTGQQEQCWISIRSALAKATGVTP